MYMLAKVQYTDAFPPPSSQVRSAGLFSEDVRRQNKLGREFIPDTDDASNSHGGAIESDMAWWGDVLDTLSSQEAL